MEEARRKREHRCLTPEEIGSKIVIFRKMMDLKQLTRALETAVNERRVQRIEHGKKDDETLRKIARAFCLRVQGFVGPRCIATDEETQAQLEKAQRELMLIQAGSFSAKEDC